MATKLEHALRLAKLGFRVFRLASNSKLPIKESAGFPQAATTDESTIRQWFGNTYNLNIGISTEDLCVVDVDVKKGGFESLADLKSKGFDLPDGTMTQVTPTGGLHLIYKTPVPVRNTISQIAKGIDTRGRGGYIVGAGSTIGGKEYVLHVRPQMETPSWLLGRISAPKERTQNALKNVVAVDPNLAWGRGEAYLKSLPPALSGERNGLGFRAAAELKDIGLTEGATLALMLEHWVCEPGLELEEVAHVVHSAYRYGQSGQGSKSPEAHFASIEVEPEQADGPVVKLNNCYAFVTISGSHRILYETTDSKGNYDIQHLSEPTFHRKLASRFIIPDGGRPTPVTKLWMQHENRRSYDGLVFEPGDFNDERYYNLWRGFAYEKIPFGQEWTASQKTAVQMWRDHLLNNICDGILDEARWLEAWCAQLVQKPDEKPGTAVVLRGKKGVGKNIFSDLLGHLFGPHYMLTADRRYFLSNFNSHFENLILFCSDEAYWSGDKSSESILKALITGESLTIERKGHEAYDIRSVHRVIILGNEDWVVPASHDERRFAVYDVTNKRQQDRAYFKRMLDAFKDGGYSALLTHLSDPKLLEDVDVGQPPLTKGLLNQKEKSLGQVQSWWRDILETGQLVQVEFTGYSWPPFVSQGVIKSQFTNYCKERGISKWIADDRTFVNTLKSLVSLEVDQDPTTREWVLRLPNLAQARRDWEKYIGHKVEWRKEL